MLRTIQAMTRRYGTEMVLVQSGQAQTIWAFLQDTHSKSKDLAQREFSPLGQIPRGMYLYIGPAEPLAQCGDRILWNQREFEVCRAEPVMVGDRVSHCWGLCMERGVDSAWGSES